MSIMSLNACSRSGGERCLKMEGGLGSVLQPLEAWGLKANGRSLNHEVGQVGALQPKRTRGESRSDVHCWAGETSVAARGLLVTTATRAAE